MFWPTNWVIYHNDWLLNSLEQPDWKKDTKKLEIIKLSEKGHPNVQIGSQNDMHESSLQKIIKDKTEIKLQKTLFDKNSGLPELIRTQGLVLDMFDWGKDKNFSS